MISDYDDDAEAWQHVYREIDERRQHIGLSWAQVQDLANVSQRTLYKMRDDGVPLKSGVKLYALARTLWWAPESIERVLDGQPPLEIAPVPDDPPEAFDLRVRIARLSEGINASQMDVNWIAFHGDADKEDVVAGWNRDLAERDRLEADLRRLRAGLDTPRSASESAMPRDAALSRRVDVLERRVRLLQRHMEHLLGRALSDGEDEPLGADEPMPDAPPAGSAQP